MLATKNHAVLLLGSNIDPYNNIQRALILLGQKFQICKKSNIWITEAVGSSGPDFLNMAVEIETLLDDIQIKSDAINHIENELKRKRTSDKYAPRTIDIDIIIFNKKVIDRNVWEKLFIALPVSEIDPDLTNFISGESILDFVENLKSSAKAELYII